MGGKIGKRVQSGNRTPRIRECLLANVCFGWKANIGRISRVWPQAAARLYFQLIGGHRMILRRITEHLKQQHWTAIAIDLGIVVLGVFIGLQVNNWNEARNDRARERIYLERL